MQRLALLAIPLLLFSPPALSADLDGYRERDVVIERAPPRVVERTRIIERHHYHQAAPVYIEPRAYYAPRVYEETYYDRPYRHRYAYAGFWRPRHFFGGHHRWHRHHHHHRGW
jgi:hypothetical protein